MTKKRTEEEILCQAPLQVWLGNKLIDIKPLSIKKSREWRAEFAKALGQIPKWVNVTTDTPETFGQAMDAMMVELPNLVSDLFFKYAEELDKEEIEDVATDAELAKAFEEVAAYALPLAGVLVKVMSRQGAEPVKSSSSS